MRLGCRKYTTDCKLNVRNEHRKHLRISASLLSAGGFLDSQTGDTQYFGQTVEANGMPVKKARFADDKGSNDAHVKKENHTEEIPRGEVRTNTTLLSKVGDRVGILCEDDDGELNRKIEKTIEKLAQHVYDIDRFEEKATLAREDVTYLEETAGRLRAELLELEKEAAASRKRVKDAEQEARLVRQVLMEELSESASAMSTRFGRLRVSFNLLSILFFLLTI